MENSLVNVGRAGTMLRKEREDALIRKVAQQLEETDLFEELPSPSTFVQRWQKLNALLRSHGLPNESNEYIWLLFYLYRGSESRAQCKARYKYWKKKCVKLEELHIIWNSGKDYQTGYSWGDVLVRDVVARSLDLRAQVDSASLSPGDTATAPLDLLEVNVKLLGYQANQLLRSHTSIDLNDPSVQTLGFDDLRAYLDNG
jgi:hypothetical protein